MRGQDAHLLGDKFIFMMQHSGKNKTLIRYSEKYAGGFCMKRKMVYLLGTVLLGIQVAGCGELESPPIMDSVSEERNVTHFNKETAQINLIEDASPETSAMAFYEYDGAGVTYSWLYDAAKEQELVNYLNQQKVQGIVDIDLSNLNGPMYGITIGTKDGTERKFVWWDGYWITDTRQVYRVDIDFNKIKENYDWQDQDSMKLTAFPNLYFLASASGTWNAKLLSKGEELNNEGLSLKVKEQKDSTITVQLINTTKEELSFGEYFGVQVQLDGEWYDIPAESELNFTDIAYLLPAGEEVEKVYDMTAFGNLLSGQYRIVVEGAVAEFKI